MQSLTTILFFNLTLFLFSGYNFHFEKSSKHLSKVIFTITEIKYQYQLTHVNHFKYSYLNSFILLILFQDIGTPLSLLPFLCLLLLQP